MDVQIFTVLGLVGWAFIIAYGEIFDWSKAQLYKFSDKRFEDKCFFDKCFMVCYTEILVERAIIAFLQFIARWLFKLSCCPMCMGVWIGVIACCTGYYHIVNPIIDIGIVGGLCYYLDKYKQ